MEQGERGGRFPGEVLEQHVRRQRVVRIVSPLDGAHRGRAHEQGKRARVGSTAARLLEASEVEPRDTRVRCQRSAGAVGDIGLERPSRTRHRSEQDRNFFPGMICRRDRTRCPARPAIHPGRGAGAGGRAQTRLSGGSYRLIENAQRRDERARPRVLRQLTVGFEPARSRGVGEHLLAAATTGNTVTSELLGTVRGDGVSARARCTRSTRSSAGETGVASRIGSPWGRYAPHRRARHERGCKHGRRNAGRSSSLAA